MHVVERVETYDHISRNRFVTRYAYHHGYFDGEEREFRGFGMVEQWDTEAFEDYVVGVQHVEGDQELAPELYQPPVTTRTWFHTGAFLERRRILHQYRHEYYRQEQHLPEPVLPDGLSAGELRECVRALKGVPLRQEVYSFDGSAAEAAPVHGRREHVRGPLAAAARRAAARRLLSRRQGVDLAQLRARSGRSAHHAHASA